MYTLEERAQITKYACMYGVHAASIHFSSEYGSKISPWTIHSIKLVCLSHMCSRRNMSPDQPITSLPTKKWGRPLLLGNMINDQLQLYLRKVREQGGITYHCIWSRCCCTGIVDVTRSFNADQTWWACQSDKAVGLPFAWKDEVCEKKSDHIQEQVSSCWF